MAEKKTTAARKGSTVKKAAGRKPTARNAATKQAGPAVELTHEMIAKRAYEIWLTNIRRAYQPAQDWAEAEKQLRAELKKKPARGQPTARKPKAASPSTATPTAPASADTRLAA